MPAQNKALDTLSRVSLGSLTTTGTNETLRAATPTALTIALIQRYFMTSLYTPNEVWRPVGINYIITTGITATAVVVQLFKNGVAPNGPSATAAQNGSATLPIQALGPNEIFVALSDYTFAAADAAGDAWSLKVLTTSTAGVVAASLVYGIIQRVGITEGVPL